MPAVRKTFCNIELFLRASQGAVFDIMSIRLTQRAGLYMHCKWNISRLIAVPTGVITSLTLNNISIGGQMLEISSEI
ncbi:MAG: hypothetical protein LBV76_02505, partial [Deltaproteobacteria bacterium]|nr:hypothetical protein [Deltaproteobacteria bacterium]